MTNDNTETTNGNTTADQNPTDKYAQHARHALDAYAQAAVPGTPNEAEMPAAMGALIGDLEHYADRLGINFADLVADAHAVYAAELADLRGYLIGDQVRLADQPMRCGTVVDITTDELGQLHHVHLPGSTQLHALRKTDIEPAPPFPRVETNLGVVTTALDAEQALIDLTTHAMLRGARNAVRESCDRLAGALVRWSGSTPDDLIAELTPRIVQQATADLAARQSDAARLAGQSFPHDLRNGIAPPGPSPSPPTNPTTPPRPGARPSPP